MDTFGSWHPPSSLETLPRDRDAHSAHLIRTMAAGVGRWQQVREAQQYKANKSTPLWTWAWGQAGTWCPPQHIRVNIPIHTVNVEEMRARWQRHPEVSSATWHWRQYKEAGGHYSFNDLVVRFSNNAVVYSGVSTNGDPPGMQHVWLQFLAATGSGFEKRRFAANIMFELLNIESPFLPAIGGVFPKEGDWRTR